MKNKISLLLAASILSLSLQAQTFWSVDFQTSENTPDNWTVMNHNSTADGAWLFNNPKNRSFFSASASNGFAIIDSDHFGSGKHQNADLISPYISLNGHSNVSLSFDHHFRKSTGDTCRLSAKINNGDWVLIKQWTSASQALFQKNLNETLSFSGNDSIQLKFNYVGSYDWYWSLDDIRLYEPSNMQLSELNHSSSNLAYGIIGGKVFMSELELNTSGTLSPIDTFNLYGNLANTTNLNNVEKILVYKGNNASAIDNESQKVAEWPVSTEHFNIPINTELAASNNLFIAFQISTSAVENDSIDLAIDSVVANNSTVYPDSSNPEGMKYLRSGMQGSYTISNNAADNPDYSNLTEAIADLNTLGVQANVSFEIQAGIYEAFLTIGAFAGADTNKTVTFKGMGDSPDEVVLTSNAGYLQKNTIQFDNAKYIRFENLKVSSTSNQYSTLVKLVNTYKDIRFSKVNFIGAEVNTSTYNNDKHLVYDNSNDAIDEGLAFDSCSFINGYMALYLQGQGFNKPLDKGFRMSHSNFSGQYSKSIYMTYNEDIEIRHNSFSNDKDLTYEFINIDLFRAHNHILIEGNTFNNTLNNKRFTAIKCRPCIGTESQSVVIANNMISGSSNSSSYSYGIDLDSETNSYIYLLNNTIALSSTSGKVCGIFVEDEFEHLNIENNIISNNSTQGLLLWLKVDNMNNKLIDYNRYETTGTGFGKYGTQLIASFQSWKDSTTQEIHSDSLSLSSRFFSAQNLHISNAEGLRVTNPLSLVTKDIDGETRSESTPCAGADEAADNTPPYLSLAFDTLVFDSFPQIKSSALDGHFADADGDPINISIQSLSDEAVLSAEIEDNMLKVTRLNADETLSAWVELKAKSNEDSLLSKVYVKMMSTDQAPIIANQIAPSHFTNYPDSLNLDLSNAFTDPDNEDSDISISIHSIDSEFISANLTGLDLKVHRTNNMAFTNKTIVLRATSNGLFVDMNLVFSGDNVTIDPEVADFEDVLLNTDSIWEAPNDGANFLTNKTWRFYNYSAATYWGGFQISSRKDTSTSGLEAQYTAVTASAFDGSDKYAVSYASYYPTDVFPNTGNSTETVKGMYVTNNLWTYRSILNGDSYATKFGGDSGNEPDYFRIKATGYNAEDEVSDSLYFYLADFRFDDNTQDYIVTEWKYFDLSSLGAVSKIRFKLESTKTNDYGMTTPAYFCMDNFNGEAPSVSDLDPIITGTASVHLLSDENSKTVNLLDLVSDPDNNDAEIVFSIESGNDSEVGNFSISDSTLSVQRSENKNGSTTLNIKALSNGKSVNFDIPVTIDVITAIEHLEAKQLRCYPNPCSNYIYINNVKEGNFFIQSTNGSILSGGKLNKVGPSKIDVSRFKAGVYYIIVKQKEQITQLKFIRQ